jgi:uncharacterized protein
MDAIASPCIKLCVLDQTEHWCLGCGRSVAEIAGWQCADENERRAILEKLPDRLEQLGGE